MKILITGNMGYVGPCVVRHLRETYPNCTIIGLDRGFFAHCLTNESRLPECLVDKQIFADVRHLPDGTFEGIDAVIHLAAISNDPMGKMFEEVTYAINHKASVEVARQAKSAGVKAFVFASSCSVYGFAEDGAKTESSELNPLTAYAKSKVMTEEDLQPLAGPSFKITCLRFATACGISDRLRLDLVLNDFVARAVVSNKIVILSDGTPWRPLINVGDMARALEWGVVRDSSVGNFVVVNAGSALWNYQVHELAHVVADVVQNVEIVINKDAQPDKRSYRVDFSLFKSLAPTHQPKSDLKGTVVDLQKGIEAMRLKDLDFSNSMYVRLNVLSGLLRNNIITDQLHWA